MFFRIWGRDESRKVPDPGCKAGAEEFPTQIVPKVSMSHELYAVGALSCNNSTLLSDIWVLLRPTVLSSFLSVLISSRFNCIVRRKVQLNHTMHVPNTVAISFPELVEVLNFLMLGDPGCFHAIGCDFDSLQYWCTQVSSPVMIFSRNPDHVHKSVGDKGCNYTGFLVVQSAVEGTTCCTLVCTLNFREQCPRLCHMKD